MRRYPLEAEMAAAIKAAVELRGGRCWSVRDSRRLDVTDLPDLIVVLPGRAVAFVELKSMKRPITEGQAAALALLRECRGVEAMVVRPVPRDGEVSYDDFLAWLSTEGQVA